MEVVLGIKGAFCAIKVSVIIIVMCEWSLCVSLSLGVTLCCEEVMLCVWLDQNRPSAWFGLSFIPLNLGLSGPEGSGLESELCCSRLELSRS